MRTVLLPTAAVFATAIIVEWWIARRAAIRVHRLRQVASDLGCGLLRGACELAGRGANLAVYAACHAALAPISWSPTHPLTWLLALVAYDFLYYWSHRLSHRVPLLWATHQVHHQSRDYNVVIGVRTGVLMPFQLIPFFLPLAIAGVPPSVYLGVTVANAVLMFGLHTRLLGDGGRLGGIFNTASHHRVHHSLAPDHLDKNFGGLLIVWDRLFGTFASERATGVATHFGVAGGGRFLNPFRANLAGWRDLARHRPAKPGDTLPS